MKFLCPSCKAKYQISDEKVAGRSVRMKCRRCGHMIQVSSEDAVGGSSAPPPNDPDAAEVSEALPAASAVAHAPPAKPNPAPGPAARAAAPRAAAPPAAAPPAPSAAKSRVPAPKPVAGAALAAAKPAPAKPAAVAPAKPAASSPLRASSEKADEASRAGTSARDAKAPAVAPAAPAVRATEESPRAAVRATEESPRAAVRATEESPRPAEEKPRAAVRSAEESPRVPAVAKPAGGVAKAPAAALPMMKLRDEEGEEEATQIARGALIGAFSAAMSEHAAASVADPLSMPGDEWFVGINGVPVGPIRLSELRAKAASGAITRESLVWRDGFEEWRPLKSFPELVAVVEESLSSARASLPFPAPNGAAAPSALADPFAPAPPPSPTPAVVAGGMSIDELQALRGRPRTSPAAWLAMVVAVGFGITLGFVFFGRADRGQAPVEKTAEQPAAAPSTPSPAAVAQVEPKADEQVISPDTKANPKTGSGSGKTTVAKTETDPKAGTAKSGLSLSGLNANAAKGPDGSGPSSTSGSAGGQLDATQLSGVVQRYTPSVKRSCWQPALDARDKDAPTSAKVTVAITINPSGSVQDATTSGDPRGYRGLAQCIAGRVRGWQFPPSGGSTTVNVPFMFVAQ